ncbi:DEAD/DEAH box helicase [Colletotrichum karsti]|uniref:ATP-dependent RNA helicase n=1 Tax=Colletotrichum karsti TaxID=1095194 RepID=A0A9P6LQ25_9PEZI|nr:DEAD/DEAH box helicase [Colletotrichum karsti]KAF9881818.1 DEAD/DEAH box helicase [Colletotrichum karsti]
MFRQSLRRCARLSGAGFATTTLRTTRPVVLKSIAQPSQTALRAPATLNAFRLYSSEAAAVANEQSGDASTPSEAPLSRFEDLRSLGVHANLVDSITKGLKYENMTDVQSKTIKPALKGMDLVAQAKTGTGKTLAFLVPILQRMIAADPTLATRRARFSADASDIRGIVISPTRELAEQIAVEAEKLCQGTGLVVQRAVGGTRKREMLMETRRRGCHLLVGTPGRLNDLLSDPDSGIRAPNLAAIVLDEADRMLDVGFERELREIVSHLPDAKQTQRQTLLFSATIPRSVISLAREWVRPDNFDFIQTVSGDEVLTHEKVKQHVVNCKGYANVFPVLYELIQNEVEKRANDRSLQPFKALVFLPTTGFVDLAGDMDRDLKRLRAQHGRHWSWRIHSKLTQPQRTRAADEFRRAESGILFSSDVTARGLDFPNVTHVIQVGAPSDREQYIHRLGRTGRAKKDGEGWLILPECEMNKARNELGGLPIQPDTTLTSTARFDFTKGEEPSEIVKQVTEATANVSGSTLGMAYMSLWGQFDSRSAQDRADELKVWYVDAMQKEDTPYISPSTAMKRGLRGLKNINTVNRAGYERDDSRDGGLGFGGRDGGRGFGGRDGGRGFGDRDGGRGFGGRDGGRGFGGRDGGRGFGGRDGGRGFGDRDGGRGFQRREPRDGFEKMSFESRSDDRGRPQRRERSSF